jgi:hypothetical protein
VNVALLPHAHVVRARARVCSRRTLCSLWKYQGDGGRSHSRCGSCPVVTSGQCPGPALVQGATVPSQSPPCSKGAMKDQAWGLGMDNSAILPPHTPGEQSKSKQGISPKSMGLQSPPFLFSFSLSLSLSLLFFFFLVGLGLNSAKQSPYCLGHMGSHKLFKADPPDLSLQSRKDYRCEPPRLPASSSLKSQCQENSKMAARGRKQKASLPK